MGLEKIVSKLLPSAEGEPAAFLLGRNDPCRCGSKKKYKKCHLAQDEEAERKRLQKAEIPPVGTEEKKSGKDEHGHHAGHDHPGHSHEKAGFARSIFNRKTGGG
ncbi:MAG: SEC-C domain-containing protein [Elusimicrobia bacterium]|nr:SEC-C domain-containing protein [Elusimicrobiota bacterium]